MLTTEHGEERFIEALGQAGAQDIVRSQGYFPDWDIKCSLGTYEIKEDVIAERTQRVFIEYRYRGEPSGIATTKADYFVIIVGNIAYYTRTHNWKEFLRATWPYLQKMRGGDNGWSEGVFVGIELLSVAHISGFQTLVLQTIQQYESSHSKEREPQSADGSPAYL